MKRGYHRGHGVDVLGAQLGAPEHAVERSPAQRSRPCRPRHTLPPSYHAVRCAHGRSAGTGSCAQSALHPQAYSYQSPALACAWSTARARTCSGSLTVTR
jgi:hypothetical protein